MVPYGHANPLKMPGCHLPSVLKSPFREVTRTLAEGVRSRERKRKPHRKRRERRRHSGELAHMDGSFHDWLEERGPLTRGRAFCSKPCYLEFTS